METGNRVKVSGGVKVRGKVSVREKVTVRCVFRKLLGNCLMVILHFDSVLSKCLPCQNVPQFTLALPK